MKDEIEVIYDEWWKEGEKPSHPEQSEPDPTLFGYLKLWNEYHKQNDEEKS